MFLRHWPVLDAVDDKAGGGGGAAAADQAAAAAAASADDKGGAAADKGAAASDKASTDPWFGIREKVSTVDGKVDDKLMARLNRYATPADALNALISVQNRISAGEMRSTLKKDATDAQIAEWRKENGIPESADKYDLKLADGMTIGTEDKPYIDAFLTRMHKANASPALVSEAVQWYFEDAERRSEERAAADKVVADASQDVLRKEWGDEFRANEARIKGTVQMMPKDAQELFSFGRLADGTPIMSHVSVLKWLDSIGRQINPVTTLVPPGEGSVVSRIDDRISAIEKMMRTDRKGYNGNTKVQAEYRDLLDARDRAKARP